MTSKEITIAAASVTSKLTADSSAYLLKEFGGYFMVNGFGGYVTLNGHTYQESAIRWTIATDKKPDQVRRIVSAFAILYCAAGRQESIYFVDTSGRAYIVNKRGIMESCHYSGPNRVTYTKACGPGWGLEN